MSKSWLTRIVERLRGPRELRPVGSTKGQLPYSVARLLHELAGQTSEGVIVEIGSFRGRSAVALATGAKVPVYAVDPHETFEGVLGGRYGAEDRGAFYRAMLRTGMYQRVRLINLPSAVVARAWEHPVGLLWIDGDHTYEGVRRDVDAWQRHLTKNAIIAFDDATDPEIGPYHVIEELLRDGWTEVASVDRARALGRATGQEQERPRL